MKKRGAQLLTLLLVLSLAACGGEKDTVDAAAGEGFDTQGTPAVVTEGIGGSDSLSPSQDMGSGIALIPWAEAGLEDHVMEWNDEALETSMRYFTGISEGDIMLSDVWELSDLRFDFVPDSYLLQITNLEALGELTNLTGIALDYGSLADLTPLSNLTNLRYLLLPRSNITDITPLAGLTNLTVLDLSGNQIGDVSPLAGLTKLTNLFLTECTISDASPLSGLTNLTILYMSDNSITDASPLAGLTELKTLDLGNNQISDVSPLSELKKLETLFLDRNSISGISPLSGLTNLTSLSLDSNQISDVTPLSGLTNLEHLVMHGNPISDITPVSFVPSLLYDKPTEFQPAESQLVEEQPEQPLEALPASLVGEYTPADTATFFPMTVDENGVCSGWGRRGGVGPANHFGSAPLSIVQKGDGSVVVSFEYTTYTFFPAGLIPAKYEGYMVPNAINLMEVSVTTYGTRTDWYHK